MNSRIKKLFSSMLGIVVLLVVAWFQLAPENSSNLNSASHSYSPELTETLRLIQQNGPYPYRQDNTVFQNRERLLPIKPRGYYREYTVKTPQATNRGARRVVTGGNPPTIYYYTEDHYRSFVELKVKP